MKVSERLWAIILAAGEGTRLARLTESLYGEPLPKQFAVLAGDRSLLQATVERLETLLPPARMVVVVPLAYEGLAREQLDRYPGIRIVAQPANRGTGPGILLPLAHVLDADPAARVLVAPSDHHLTDPRSFTAAIGEATAHASAVPVTLVGVEADHPETEYGWIQPGVALQGRVHRIDRFVEKPSAPHARELFEGGALWNTFLMVAEARRLWRVAEERLPAQAAVIQACVARAGARGPCLSSAYQKMADANFSRAVLETAGELGVVRAPGCGFSDWGSPERVLGSLRGTADFDRLLSRMAVGSREARLGRIAASSLIRGDRAERRTEGDLNAAW